MWPFNWARYCLTFWAHGWAEAGCYGPRVKWAAPRPMF